MIDRLKKQTPKKLLIMIINFIRMAFLNAVHMGNVNASLVQNINPKTEIAVWGGGSKLTLKHSVFTRRNVSFRVEGGELTIGTSFFNQGCAITCMDNIQIGDNCLFGPNVVVVDHDHEYRYTDERRGNHYKKAPISIGNNVWIGANVTILRGTQIEDGAVIGAGCVIRGKVEKNTVVVNKQDIHIKNIQRIDE